MEHRKPYDLTYTIRAYNIFQIMICTYAVSQAYHYGFSFGITWKCIGTDGEFTNHLMELNQKMWYFIILRLVEFIETIFFILRKKFEQVSMLHVYHHVSTVVLLIIFLRNSGGVMDMYIGAVNSIVHIIMYSYYFLSSFKSLTKFTNIIKPWLTLVQIAQLVMILGNCIVAVQPSCGTVHYVFYLQIINICILLSMFVNFYIKSNRKLKSK